MRQEISQLRKELGPVLTAQEVADLFGIDHRTVKKYYHLYGGIKVAPRLFRFFENIIRRRINCADSNAPTRSSEVAGSGEDQRQDTIIQMVRTGEEGTAQSNRMGGGRKKADSETKQGEASDPHGILSWVGNKLSK
jgi:hypothetical protein